MKHLVRPFAALRPRRETAQAVIAPPYDVVDTDEARALAADQPESFLHISRPEIDLPENTDPYADEVYARGAGNLRRLVEARTLEREANDCFYAYRMAAGKHSQTGVAFAASVEAYESGRIHAHELTRPDKENDRVRNIESLNAQTGPVLMTYKTDPQLGKLIGDAVQSAPLFEARGQHDVLHSVWRIDDPAKIDALNHAIDAIGELYIADGHHRSAAAARVAATRHRSTPGGVTSHDYFLSVAFPDDQMQIFDYNRIVTELNGLANEAFLEAVGKEFQVEAVDGQAKPISAGTFGMYLAGRWFRLEPRSMSNDDDPVARLDVSLLQNLLIDPILGISDPRTDTRIGFIGGVRGLGELERRVDSNNAAVAFALFPTGIRDLMAVADAGRLMPPKSTWFEPKLADGLLTHVLD